ncbi:hypothetical protein RUA4292_00733 [Ruegeria atlantica]|uniref:Uncharacterized protein n=1 Tax=Ruegeria atlantica TaxID=81569 RepID=A0A0P1EC18_9RHOB|nr:hypothetical protein RUA4292_00733 [Ruegeria atlantica]
MFDLLPLGKATEDQFFQKAGVYEVKALVDAQRQHRRCGFDIVAQDISKVLCPGHTTHFRNMRSRRLV